jgi:hypothetical protein
MFICRGTLSSLNEKVLLQPFQKYIPHLIRDAPDAGSTKARIGKSTPLIPFPEGKKRKTVATI